LALQIVDTEEFERLQDLKQLGLTYLIYPGAVHTRFEYSLGGVYSLAGEAINNLNTYQGEELGIDHVDMQTVKLAGLLHDIGHGLFSHLFEHEVLPRVDPSFFWRNLLLAGRGSSSLDSTVAADQPCAEEHDD
jgi:HD superfamily phosphohydrolase